MLRGVNEGQIVLESLASAAGGAIGNRIESARLSREFDRQLNVFNDRARQSTDERMKGLTGASAQRVNDLLDARIAATANDQMAKTAEKMAARGIPMPSMAPLERKIAALAAEQARLEAEVSRANAESSAGRGGASSFRFYRGASSPTEDVTAKLQTSSAPSNASRWRESLKTVASGTNILNVGADAGAQALGSYGWLINVGDFTAGSTTDLTSFDEALRATQAASNGLVDTGVLGSKVARVGAGAGMLGLGLEAATMDYSDPGDVGHLGASAVAYGLGFTSLWPVALGYGVTDIGLSFNSYQYEYGPDKGKVVDGWRSITTAPYYDNRWRRIEAIQSESGVSQAEAARQVDQQDAAAQRRRLEVKWRYGRGI